MEASILGSGISGLSAAYHLKKYGVKTTIYEKDAEVGGLCKSKKYGDMVFDYGVHVSFTTNNYVRDLFDVSVNGSYEEKQFASQNYWRGHWVKHEPQNNLYSLPKEVIKKSLMDFFNARYEDHSEIRNYGDWCRKKFGKFFAQNFSDVYTKKFWTVVSQQLTIDWIETRLNPPDIETIIDGALGIFRENNHYVKTFRYPKVGGYASFLKILYSDLDIRLNTFPVEIDLKRKELRLNTGEVKSYEVLVSSIPLPQFIKLSKNVPKKILDATNRLKWTSLLMLNFWTEQKIDRPSQWNYYYDEEIPYSRIFYMSKFAESNAPENCETLQVEIPYSQSNPLSIKKTELINKVVHNLSETERIPMNKLHYLGDINIEYGYVIYDFNREEAVKTINHFLNENGVHCCGRFGEWRYLWSDQSLLSGKQIADYLGSKVQS